MSFNKNVNAGALLGTRLQTWSQQHAMLMAFGLAGVVVEPNPALVAAIATGSFMGFLLRFRGQWTDRGTFGPGNAVTLLRLLASLALLLLATPSAWWPVVAGSCVLLGDGLDGWLARRSACSSEFGQYFDYEVDAFFCAVLSMVLFYQHGLGPWVLIPGALRYGFILLILIGKPPTSQIKSNRYTRAMGTLGMVGLLLCLAPLPLPCRELALAVTLGLSLSFLYSISRLYSPVRVS